MKAKIQITNRRRAGVFLLTGAVCLLAGGAVSAGPDGRIDETRTALEKWVETRRIISQEKRDMVLAREMLNERIELVEREIESLGGKIKDAEDSIAEADKKRQELIVENDKFKQASASLGGTLEALEGRTRQLVQRLPDPIRDRIKPLTQRLPDGDGQTKLSTAERFQNVVGILNEVDKFNREITAASEVRSLSDGSSVEVTALYVGLGQGYYANASGTLAGVGKATESGWQWQEANEVAVQISEAIAILKNEKAASFVQMPVDIQ